MKLGNRIDSFIEQLVFIFMRVLFLPLDIGRFVYRVINGPEKPSPLYELYQQDLADLGRAFPILLEGLPSSLQNLKAVFSSFPLLDSNYKKEVMLKDPDVINGGPKAVDLAEHGLSPKILYDAADAIGSLLSRANRRGYGHGNGCWEIILDIGLSESRYKIKDKKIWLAVLGEAQECLDMESAKKAALMFDWWICISLYKPYIFPDFKVESFDGGKIIKLVPDDRKFKTVVERWGATHMTEVEKV